MIKHIKLTLLLLTLSAAHLFGQQIGLRVDNKAVHTGEEFYLPVYIDSSVTGKNITSYQLNFNFSGSLEAISLDNADGISSSWGAPTVRLDNQNRTVSVAAAGTTALAGTGLLFKIRFKALSASSYADVSFNAGRCYFNEGNPTPVFINGRVNITDVPTLSLSPGEGVVLKGETLQFTAYSGAAPYTFSVTDTTVGSIDASGLFTARRVGFTNVTAEDTNGIKGTTARQIEVRGFRLSLPDTAVYVNRRLQVPLRTTDLTGLGITSGDIEIAHGPNAFNVVRVITEGTVLQNQEVSYRKLEGVTRVSFAGTTPVTGSGILLILEIDALASTHFNFQKVVFNESLRGLGNNGSLRVNPLANLTVYTHLSQAKIGDRLQYTVSGGEAPYTWTVSNPSLADIDSTGRLMAKRGGTVKVRVSDVNGSSGESSVLTIFDSQVSIATERAPLLTTYDLPVTLDTVPTGTRINAIEMTFSYGKPKLDFKSVVRTGALTEGWSISESAVDHDTYKIALASATGITSAGTLFYLKFDLTEEFRLNEVVAVSIDRVVLNEGTPVALAQNGSITGTTCEPDAPTTTSAEHCGPGQVTLGAAGASAGNYRWYTAASGGEAINSVTAASYTTPLLDTTTTYYVSIVVGACESARTAVTATIKELATAPLVSDTVNYCQGASASALTATGSNLQWYLAETGGTALSGAPTPNTETIGNTNYYVSQTIDGCESERARITVAVRSSLPAPTAIGAELCGPGVVTLRGEGGAAGSYRWYTTATGGEPIANESSATYTTPYLTASTTYYVSIISGTCESERTAVTATITSPAAAPTATAAAHCGPGSMTLIAEGASAGNYRWYTSANGEEPIADETTASFTTPILDTTTTYYVSMIVDSCETARTPVTATINSIPAKPTFEVSRNDTGSFVLTSSSPSGNQWLVDGVEIEGATGQSHVVVQDGHYSVRVTENGCSNTSDASTDIITSAKGEVDLAKSLLMYPNPAKEQVFIEGSNGVGSRQVEVRLYNALGKLLEIRTAEKASSGWKVAFTVNQYPKGMYFIRIDNGSGIASRPLLVE